MAYRGSARRQGKQDVDELNSVCSQTARRESPPPEDLLFLANAATQLATSGQCAIARSNDREGSVDSLGFVMSMEDVESQLAYARLRMLEWAWRLGVALGPFWALRPSDGLRDFAFVGWTLGSQQLLSEIYDLYFDAYWDFVNGADAFEDHPLSTFNLSCQIMAIGWPGDSPRPCLMPDNDLYDGSRHIAIESAECFTGDVADRILRAFENVRMLDRLGRAADQLDKRLWVELYPALFQEMKGYLPPTRTDRGTGPSHPSASSKVVLDDLACAVAVRLMNEGKAPTPTLVARELNCCRSRLYQQPQYMKLKEAAERDAIGRKNDLPSGWRNKSSGALEAHANSTAIDDD